MKFDLQDPRDPAGDQPQAIAALVQGLRLGRKYQTLEGVTGSGKTFVMAKIIEQVQRPTLVLSPNKLLARQTHRELAAAFPNNAVHYYVSDCVNIVPETYDPEQDRYDSGWVTRDRELTGMRKAALASLLTRRRDVIVVGSVSVVFGTASPEDYRSDRISLEVNDTVDVDQLLARLSESPHHLVASRELKPGTFRAQQSWVDVFPSWETQFYRIEHAAGTMTRLFVINARTGKAEDRDCLHIIPVADSPFPQVCIPSGVQNIQEELANRLGELEAQGNRCAAVRLKKRTLADLEELQGGTPCSGVQYYLPRLRGYPPGQPPDTLLSFFDKDFLLFVDESHIAVPQLRGMYLSDRERRLPLVEYGFRLPTSLDYRPLRLSEFEQRINQAVFVSATPGPYELQKSGDRVIEMVNRPTGIPDPTIQVIAKSLQEQHLLQAIRERAAIDEQVLVMVPTKRGAEDVAKRLADANIRSQWLHGDLGMKARKELFEDFNNHKLDVLVGVQLLREGLDLPRVSLVAILGADETLSRGEAALLQFVGRAARHPHGHVLLYANTITPAMIRVIYKTRERRRRQEDYNHHGISPYAIRQAV